MVSGEGGKSSGHGPGVGKNEPAAPLTPAEKQNAYHERLRVDGAVQDQNIRKQAALTSAEKQKVYRERGGDKLRAANRLRMAAKRKKPNAI